MLKKLSALIRSYLTPELGVVLVASLCYLLFKNFGSTKFLYPLIKPSWSALHHNIHAQIHYWSLITHYALGIITLLLLPYLFSLFTLKKTPENFPSLRLRYHRGSLYLSLGLLLFMFIVILVAHLVLPEFRSYYPVSQFAATGAGWFLLYSLFYFLYIVSWEYFCHSFLLFPFEKKLGSFSILISLMPFIILHFGKPLPEQLGSVVAGLALAILARESRTFWYGALMHGLISLFMDASSLLFRSLLH